MMVWGFGVRVLNWVLGVGILDDGLLGLWFRAFCFFWVRDCQYKHRQTREKTLCMEVSVWFTYEGHTGANSLVSCWSLLYRTLWHWMSASVHHIQTGLGVCVYFNHKWNKKAPSSGVKSYEVQTQTWCTVWLKKGFEKTTAEQKYI